MLANPPIMHPKRITSETREEDTDEGEQSLISEKDSVTEL